ncbi:hypothetical protein Tco_1285792 [Tanacetum coccineum]
MGPMMMKEPPAERTGGQKEEGQELNPLPTTSAPNQEFETCVQEEQAEERDMNALIQDQEGRTYTDLRIQDIEDMLLPFLCQESDYLSVEERIAFNVSLRKFTRRVCQPSRRVVKIFNWVLKLSPEENNLNPSDSVNKNGVTCHRLYWNQRLQSNARAMIQAIDKKAKDKEDNEEFERFCRGTTHTGDDLRFYKGPY